MTEFVDEAVASQLSQMDLHESEPSVAPCVYDCEKDLEKALTAKEEGNVYFRNKEYDESLESYSKAIMYCPEDNDNKELLATLYGNRSAAYFFLDEFELVIEDCTSAVNLKQNYVKVLARRMLANEKLEKYEEALSGLSVSSVLELKYINYILVNGRCKTSPRLRSCLSKDQR